MTKLEKALSVLKKNLKNDNRHKSTREDFKKSLHIFIGGHPRQGMSEIAEQVYNIRNTKESEVKK